MRIILILMAGSILLLHTLMPHQHHSELEAKENFELHESARNWLDLIKLAFHLDQGDDHLENYKISDNLRIIFDTFQISEIIFIPYPQVLHSEIDAFPFVVNKPLSRYFACKIRFRGPPCQV